MTTASDALVVGVQDLTEALRLSQADPADAVRLLMQLITTSPVLDAPDAVTLAAQTATAAMLQRCALVSLANACLAYNPASSTQLLTLFRQVNAVFDTAIVYAADVGDRDVYTSLRALRSAVATNLNTRAAALPALITVKVPQPEASLVLAMRLYDNTLREPGLVARAGVVHPWFMPTTFEALAS